MTVASSAPFAGESFIGKKIHFIGIGGSGMSGLARIALADGITVSGSDAKDSSVLTALSALGAKVFSNHDASHVDGADVVIYSTAISPTNPEIVRAIERSIPIMTRAKALAMLMHGLTSIAIAGTHGKTTTSSMATVAFQACGADPSFAIGGTLTASGSNAHRGSGQFFIAEADESDGSFVAYHPMAAIVTNVEHDHVDFFSTPEEVVKVFADFAETIPASGLLIYCNDDPGSKALGESVTHCTVYSYGVEQSSDLKIDQIELTAQGSRARAIWKGRVVGTIELQVPGHHNLLNAAGTLALGMALDLNPVALLRGLHSFRGAGRRFELKATVNGIRIIDDYGHHPTEISVTLDAARRYADTGRVLVIFQPHRYSRTQAFLDQFATSLDKADDVTLLEIYAASEKPIPGISAQLIAEKMVHGHFLPNFIEASDRVVEIAKPGDVILTLGAGDVNSLAPIIADGLSRRFG
ncbi:MurC UDP-N-acetylmuramate-alanine ligase [Candidatus Nanopelagicaceae bacterium]